MKRLKGAFTLIELIIVLTILAILALLSFINFTNYTREGRNASRTADIMWLTKWLELYSQKYSIYPEPENERDVLHNSNLAWKEWNLVGSTFLNQDYFINSDWLKDPLTSAPYSYSKTSRWIEFELWTMLESENGNTAYILWNYNGKVLSISTWSYIEFIAIPSITSSENFSELSDTLSNNSLAFKWFKNIPFSYANHWTWGFIFQPTPLVIYSWSLSNLESNEWKINFWNNLKNAYLSTSLWNTVDYKDLTTNDFSSLTPATNAYIESIIKASTWKKFK